MRTKCGIIVRLVAVALLVMAQSGCARANPIDEQIDALLSRAHEQSLSGRISSPPGDNLLETIELIAKLADRASPDMLPKLAELSKMIDGATARTLQARAQEPTPPAVSEPEPAELAPVVASPLPVIASAPSASPPPSRFPSTPPPQSAPPSTATASLVTPAPPPSPKPPAALPSGTKWDALYRRGQQAEGIGDISGARRFYEAAATHGLAAAALCLAKLYDPSVLKSMRAVGGITGDPAKAEHWYREAARLGDPNASRLLQALVAR